MTNEQSYEALMRGVEFSNRMPFYHDYERDMFYWDEYTFLNRN